MDTSEEATTSNDGAAVPGIIGEDGQPIGRVVRFDAGWLGCDRLPMIQRRQLQSVDVGDVVEFIVYDPSSKEDVPPFARMLGHRVRWITPQEDGALRIAVERMR
jgi:TusA-related sulfurtransferase